MQKYISDIPLFDGERWWGGGGGDGQNQPYGAGDSARIDLRVHGNTSSPLLVSSCGRYIWSEKPFGYEFRGGHLLLDSDVEAIVPVPAGESLRDAYLAAAKAHMRFEGRTPPDIFFSLPQWNNWIEIFMHGMDQKAADDYTAEGSRWLVAPVTTPDNAKTVELPAGTWRDDLGALHEGPATLRLENVPLSRLPRYERLSGI